MRVLGYLDARVEAVVVENVVVRHGVPSRNESEEIDSVCEISEYQSY